MTKMQSWINFYLRRSKNVDKKALEDTIGGVITDFGNSILADYIKIVNTFPGEPQVSVESVRNMIRTRIRDFHDKEEYE